jgi:hypothetical protein
LKNLLGRCLSGQKIEIWLRTEKPKMGDFWQRHFGRLSGVLPYLRKEVHSHWACFPFINSMIMNSICRDSIQEG